MLSSNVPRQMPLQDADRSFKYLCRASCQVGICTPQDFRLFADKTEYAGRGAGRGSCCVEIGSTSVVKPASLTIARANSNHEHSPALVACTIPVAFFRHSSIIARARSEERRVGKECRSRWSPY